MDVFELTEIAEEKILERIKAEGKEGRTLRIRIDGWTADDFFYRLEVVPPEAIEEDDVSVQEGELPVVIAADSADRMQGASLDFVDTPNGPGFSMENPNPVFDDELSFKVQRALDEKINPGVGMHGGRVQLMEMRDGAAFIRFDGGCVGCGLSKVTLKQGVDRTLREAFPEISQIVDITDHASGTNPYYKPEDTAEAESPVA